MDHSVVLIHRNSIVDGPVTSHSISSKDLGIFFFFFFLFSSEIGFHYI